METLLRELLHWTTRSLEVVGLFAVVVGAIYATYGFLREPRREGAFDQYRSTLGRAILLGLEFLVAADIIETLSAPTLEHLAILGGIVLIRTVISFSLNWELSHRETGSVR